MVCPYCRNAMNEGILLLLVKNYVGLQRGRKEAVPNAIQAKMDS